MISIRRAQPKDHSRILELGEHFIYTPHRVDPLFNQLSDEKVPLLVHTQLVKDQIQIFVAESQGQVVGFISCIFEREMSFYVAYQCGSILFLVVDPSHQKQGIASQLLEFIFNYARKQRVKILRVGADGGNQIAINLYEKKGFKNAITWYVYRIYQGQQLQPKQQHAFQLQHKNFNLFPKHILNDRPLAWLHHPSLSSEGINHFLFQQLTNQLYQERVYWLKNTPQNWSSLILKRDKVREQYYKISENLWTISDLYHHGKDANELVDFLKGVIASLKDFAMIEYWVSSHNKTLCSILENAGMHKVYQGIAFLKEL